MLDLEGLKNNKDLVASIDWDMTPRKAFEEYQLKSVDNWKYHSDSPVCYFYVSTWRGEAKLLLIRRSLKQSEELAEVSPPEDLMRDCISSQEGEDMPRGQLPLTPALKNWLYQELGSRG
ncbi:DVU0772 family protein [Dethiosulfatarculus sandiegensis]|uniref:Uncharacterized protein n=1 Tax=Dethiosulfatarculus sandiegensis TaxID=1429043 RepID=A0A0D2GAC1_9BACT|nr:hypothetical protein [Dethiosulfatarculus sandiegensis]KIX11837.1 hypothetical protein X474_22435 [Dethiosulfatarculus sandiegensis]